MITIKRIFFYNLVFIGLLAPKAVAVPERTFELSAPEYANSWLGPEKVFDSKGIWESIFPATFLKTPVGKMVNSNKNTDLLLSEKLNSYEYVKAKSCPPNMPNDDSSKHCYTVPSTLENIINHGQDAPISLIQKLHKQSYEFWLNYKVPKNPPLIQSFGVDRIQNVALDIRSIKELNLRAADVWKKLIECNNNNPEQARIAFFYSNREKFCANNSSVYLFGLIQELGFNFQQYIISTMPLAEISNYRANPDSNIIAKNPHPLLTEFAILNWSAFFNHGGETSFETVGSINSTMFQFEAFKRSMQTRQFTEYSYQQTAPNMQAGATALFKAIVNNLIFVSLVHYDNLEFTCSKYGLWPALNRSILYNGNLLNYHSSPIYSELTFLNDMVEYDCGPKVDFLMTPERDGAYGLYFQSNLIDMRLRYYDFIGIQHLPKD